MKLNKNKLYFLATLLMMLPLSVFSAEENIDGQAPISNLPALNADSVSADPMNSGYLLQLVIGLVIVLLCILALAWAAKKVNKFRLINDDSLKILGGLSMGARERVVLLQVGESQLLLGVSPGRINTLHVLDAPIETARQLSAEENSSDKQGCSENQSFSDKLKSMMADASRMKNV